MNDTVRDEDGSLKLQQRLNDTVVKCTSNPRDIQFVSSISDFFKKKGYLTGAQFQNFERIEKKYSGNPADTAWDKEYGPKQQHEFAIAVRYYRGLGTYFNQVVAQVDTNPEYKPDRATFERLTNNKFVKRIIREHDTKARFNVGDLVSVCYTKSLENVAEHAVNIYQTLYLKTQYTNEASRGIRNSGYSVLTPNFYDSAINEYSVVNPTNLWIITAVNPCGPFAGHKGSKLYVVTPVNILKGNAAAGHEHPICVEECNLKKVQ